MNLGLPPNFICVLFGNIHWCTLNSPTSMSGAPLLWPQGAPHSLAHFGLVFRAGSWELCPSCRNFDGEMKFGSNGFWTRHYLVGGFSPTPRKNDGVCQLGLFLPIDWKKKVPNHQPAFFQTKPCWWVKDMMDTRPSSGNVRIIYQNIQQLLICSWLDPRPRFTQLTKRQPIVTIGNHHPK